jgi:hypothetical protein
MRDQITLMIERSSHVSLHRTNAVDYASSSPRQYHHAAPTPSRKTYTGWIGTTSRAAGHCSPTSPDIRGYKTLASVSRNSRTKSWYSRSTRMRSAPYLNAYRHDRRVWESNFLFDGLKFMEKRTAGRRSEMKSDISSWQGWNR